MLWFWGPLDSHVMIVTWVQWQAGVGWVWPWFPHPPFRVAAPPLDLKPPPEVETLFNFTSSHLL